MRRAVGSLFLRRAPLRRSSATFKDAKLIGLPIGIGSIKQVVEMLKNGEADAYSNLTHLLSLMQTNLPGWRIVPGSYMMTMLPRAVF